MGARGWPDAGVIYHHCRDHRKSSGAPVSLFAEYRMGQAETAQGMPKVYESSLGIRRSFLRRWRDAALIRGREAAERGL